MRAGPDQHPTELEIRRALKRPQSLCLNFQPVADLRRGMAAGYEVLARFGAVPPDTWFASASIAGLGPRADRAIVSRALETRITLPPGTFLTINVSPDSLIDAAFEGLTGGDADLRGVVFEITEHAPVHDYTLLMRATDLLREQGAGIAVDDAGAGYSSMRHVLALRPQFVKVDREFVAGCDRDPARLALVEAITAYAERIGAAVIAEGVETLAELQALMTLGVPFAQGYFFGEAGETWSGISDEAARAIAQRAADPDGSVLGCIANEAAAPGKLAVDGGRWEAVCDRWSRPTALRSPDGQTREAMTALAIANIDSTLLRAVSRPAIFRFDPIAVIDERGALLGLAPVERLVRAALSRKLAP